MSSEIAIKVKDLSKCYQVYQRPSDRLKQMLSFGRKKYYREFWALKQTSFEIRKGETVGIIGRNGSGKSTLLQLICGTVTPTTGFVETKGLVSALLELGAGFNPEFSGRENVVLNAAILGISSNTIKSRMNEILEFSELGEFLDQPVKTYSSGMYSRLAFSIAIHVEPEILIVDETLAVGDARFVAKCMKRIKELQSKGVTILFVSHDVTSIRTLCERAIWLDRGSLVDAGDVFPVTAKFMEYMFQDEVPEEEALQTEIAVQSVSELDTKIAPAPEGNSISVINNETVPKEIKEDKQLDARPVTHWGSHTGLILSASVCNSLGEKKDVHSWGDPLHVVVDLYLPPQISRDHLSLAISIKDLKGSDLIVSTTHDFGQLNFPLSEKVKVAFKFNNPLVTGKYLLVAAVENRQHRDIHYYEYIEGAHYFSSLAQQRLFGIFHPSIKQELTIK